VWQRAGKQPEPLALDRSGAGGRLMDNVWNRSSNDYGSFSQMASTQLRMRARAQMGSDFLRSSDVYAKDGFKPLPQRLQMPRRTADGRPNPPPSQEKSPLGPPVLAPPTWWGLASKPEQVQGFYCGLHAGKDTAGHLGFGSLAVGAGADARQEVQNYYQGQHAGKDTSSMLNHNLVPKNHAMMNARPKQLPINLYRDW